jgi:hypothetical protein
MIFLNFTQKLSSDPKAKGEEINYGLVYPKRPRRLPSGIWGKVPPKSSRDLVAEDGKVGKYVPQSR